MNKFKDFLYDKSDILIALAILLVAALIIAWRLGAIVEYPKELIDQNNNTTEITEETVDNNNVDTEADKPENKPENKPEEKPVDNSADKPLWENGVLSKDVTVYWQGSSATALIQCAVDAGLLESYEEYETICNNQGLENPEIVPVGESTTFKAGSSKEDIVIQIKA